MRMPRDRMLMEPSGWAPSYMGTDRTGTTIWDMLVSPLTQ